MNINLSRILKFDLKHGAFPERPKDYLLPHEVQERLRKIGISFSEKPLFITYPDSGDYNLIAQVLKLDPSKIRINLNPYEKQDYPYWLPRLVTALSENSIDVYINYESANVAEGRNGKVERVGLYKVPKKLFSKERMALIIPARQLLTSTPEVSLLVLVRLALSKDSEMKTQRILDHLRLIIDHAKTTSHPLDRTLRRLTQVQEIANFDSYQDDDELKTKSFGASISAIKNAPAPSYLEPSVWQSTFTWRKDIYNSTSTAQRISPEEIIPVYVNLNGLNQFSKGIANSRDKGFDILVNQCALLRVGHKETLRTDLLPKFEDETVEVRVPKFHKIGTRSRSFVAKINGGAHRSFWADLKGVGSEKPIISRDSDGILRGDSALRELFIWCMIDAYLSIPNIRENIRNDLIDMQISHEERMITSIGTVGVLGVLFVPNLQTKAYYPFPHVKFGGILVRPPQPYRKSPNAGLNEYIENNVFNPLGLSSSDNSTNIQGFYDLERGKYCLIDFGTATQGDLNVIERIAPLLGLNHNTDIFLKELAEGLAEGRYDHTNTEKILAYIQNWVWSEFAE